MLRMYVQQLLVVDLVLSLLELTALGAGSSAIPEETSYMAMAPTLSPPSNFGRLPEIRMRLLANKKKIKVNTYNQEHSEFETKHDALVKTIVGNSYQKVLK